MKKHCNSIYSFIYKGKKKNFYVLTTSLPPKKSPKKQELNSKTNRISYCIFPQQCNCF